MDHERRDPDWDALRAPPTTVSERLHVLAAQVITWPGITELERRKAYHEITLLALRTHF